MPRKPQPVVVTEQLRAFIEESKMTGNALAVEAGIPRQIVNYFLADKRGLSGASIDRICRALGLKLVQTRRKRSG